MRIPRAVTTLCLFLFISLSVAAGLEFTNLLDSATLTGDDYTVTPGVFGGSTAYLANLSAAALAGGGHSLVIRLSTFGSNANVVVVLPSDGGGLVVEHSIFNGTTLVVLVPEPLATLLAPRSIRVSNNDFVAVFPSPSGWTETVLLQSTLRLPTSLPTAAFMLMHGGTTAGSTVDVAGNSFRLLVNGTVAAPRSSSVAAAALQLSGSSSTKVNVSANVVQVVLRDGAANVEGLSISGQDGGSHGFQVLVANNSVDVFAMRSKAENNNGDTFFAPAGDKANAVNMTVGTVDGVAFRRLAWSVDTIWNISRNSFRFTTSARTPPSWFGDGGESSTLVAVAVQSPAITGVTIAGHNTSGTNLSVWVCDNSAVIDAPDERSVVAKGLGLAFDVALFEVLTADFASTSGSTTPPFLRIQRNTLTTVGEGIVHGTGISVGRSATPARLIGGSYMLFEGNTVTVPFAQHAAEGISFAVSPSVDISASMVLWLRSNSFNLSSAQNVSGIRFPSLTTREAAVMVVDNVYVLSAPRAIAAHFANVSITGPALQLTSLGISNQTVQLLKVSGGSTAVRIQALQVTSAGSVLVMGCTVTVTAPRLRLIPSTGDSPQQLPMAIDEDANLISAFSIDDVVLTDGDDGQSRVGILTLTVLFANMHDIPRGEVHILPMNPLTSTFFRGVSFNGVLRAESYGYIQITNAVVRFLPDDNNNTTAAPAFIALTPQTAGVHFDTVYLANQSRLLMRNITVTRDANVDSTDVIGIGIQQASGRSLCALGISDVSVHVRATTAPWINPSAYGVYLGALAFRLQSTITLRNVRTYTAAARSYGMTFGIVSVTARSTFTIQHANIQSFASANSAGIQLLYLNFAENSNITLDAVSVASSAASATIEDNKGIDVQVVTGSSANGQCSVRNSIILASGIALRIAYGRLSDGATFTTANNTLMSHTQRYCDPASDVAPLSAFQINCTGSIGPAPITLEPLPTLVPTPPGGSGQERALTQGEIAMVAGITGGVFVLVVLLVAAVFLGVRAFRHRRRVSDVEPVSASREPVDGKSVASLAADVECDVVVVDEDRDSRPRRENDAHM